MNRTAKLWNGFWFSQGSSKQLALLRIGIGTIFLMNRTGMNRLLRFEWAHMFPTFPLHTFLTESGYRIAAYRLPYPGLGWMPIPSLHVYQWLEIVLVLVGILFTLGIRTRITGPMTAVLYAYLFLLSQFSFHHGDFALLIALWCIAFSRAAGKHWSAENIMRRAPNTYSATMLPVRMSQVLCSCILFFGGLHKLNAGWWNGSVLRILWESGRLPGPFAAIMGQYGAFHWAGIFMSLSLLFCGIGLWFSSTRRYALTLGILTQIIIDISYENTLTFNYLIIVLLCTFITKEDVQWLRKLIPGNVQAHQAAAIQRMAHRNNSLHSTQ